MNNRFSRLNKIRTLVFGAATLGLLWLPARAQTTAGQSAQPQDNQVAAAQDGQELRNFDPGRDRDRREVASFDLWLDQHQEVGEQIRRDPSLLDNQRFLNDHPVLQSYLQNSPRVRDWVRLDAPAF